MLVYLTIKRIIQIDVVFGRWSVGHFFVSLFGGLSSMCAGCFVFLLNLNLFIILLQ